MLRLNKTKIECLHFIEWCMIRYQWTKNQLSHFINFKVLTIKSVVSSVPETVIVS